MFLDSDVLGSGVSTSSGLVALTAVVTQKKLIHVSRMSVVPNPCLRSDLELSGGPLSSELGTYETVKARFWHWLSGQSPTNLLVIEE